MFRHPFTTQDARRKGLTIAALKHGVATGHFQRVRRGVYLEGPHPPSPLERALGSVVLADGVASGTLAAQLYGLDSVRLRPPFATVARSRNGQSSDIRRSSLTVDDVIMMYGIRCTTPRRTLIDLAALIDDTTWEHALESALRKQLIVVSDLGAVRNVPGVARMRRVLSLRPLDAPATESLLETLMVQLIRSDTTLPIPERQVEVRNAHNIFVGRVDLAWPQFGIFIELDGQQHLDQPLYDASRQTAIVAATGWRPARFTWHEVTKAKSATLRRLHDLLRSSPSKSVT